MTKLLLSKLSAGRSRVEIIASMAAPPPAAAPPSPPPAKPAAAPPAEDADAKVTSSVAAAKDAIAKAIADQEADPDKSDPADVKVLEGLKASQESIEEVAKAQAEDNDAKPVTAAAPPVATPSEGGPVGKVEDSAECLTPGCGHMAVEHGNMEGAPNSGACAIEGCTCMAMKTDTSGANQEDPDTPAAEEDGNSPGEPNEATAAKFAPQPADALPSPADAHAPAPAPAQNEPPAMDGSDEMGPAFTIPIGVIEGQPTGDGREIALEALTWRVPPMPLMGLKTATHDPTGMDMNAPAVLAGRIDELERKPGEGSTQIISAKGFYLPNEDGMCFAGITDAMGRCGVSADIAVEDSIIKVEEVDDIGYPMDIAETLTEGMIMGFTQCPFPAFAGAYIVLGDGTDAPEAKAIPQAVEGADEVASEAPAAVVAGGQLLHLMARSECEACDTGQIEVLTAAGGPERPPSAWFSDPGFAPGDGRLVEILGREGRREEGGKFACPLTVTADGQVFGHIAPWNVCHTGKPGQCVVAPHSAVDYAHFKRGQHVLTAEGHKIRTGTLTADTGHAGLRLTPSSAMAHYDNTALQAADVNVGEDDYGVWVAGALRPGVTEAQIRNLTAGSLSGDWRDIGGQLELVAALAVPMPGFPLAVVNHALGERRAVTAAGAYAMYRLKNPEDGGEPGAASFDALTAAVAPLLPLAKQAAADSIAALR